MRGGQKIVPLTICKYSPVLEIEEIIFPGSMECRANFSSHFIATSGLLKENRRMRRIFIFLVTVRGQR